MEEPSDKFETQFAALRRRVNASGLYLHEIEEFGIAREAWARVSVRLEVVVDLGSITTPESRNIVHKVCLRDGTIGVLKVAGNAREPGEGEVLEAWRALGLPCVRPMAWGYERVEVDREWRVASWLLTEFMPLPTMRVGDEIDALARKSSVCALVAFIRQFHFSAARATSVRTWWDRTNVHLRWVMPLIRDAGLIEPDDWERKLKAASRRGSALVHGDPAGSNVLVTPTNSFVLLDPPGALVGPREADAGQIASHMACAGSRDAEEKGADTLILVDEAARADRSLNPATIGLFAGINLMIWSGYFLVSHYNVNVLSTAQDPDSERSARLRSAHVYLAVARQLVSEFEVDQ